MLLVRGGREAYGVENSATFTDESNEGFGATDVNAEIHRFSVAFLVARWYIQITKGVSWKKLTSKNGVGGH